MIKLFLSDIDGCISEPYTAYDLDGVAQLRRWAGRSETDARYPRVGLCSGRAYAYVEAVAQAVGVTGPALFESGGGRLDLADARIRWNPALTPAVERALDAARAFLLEHVVPRSETVSFDYGKRSQAGVVSPTPGECERYLGEIEAWAEGSGLHAYHTPYSVDVVPEALTKVQALRWLAEMDGLSVSEIAFIGDTDGDAPAIAACGLGFAPANGARPAREAADVVTEGAVMDGVLEAYRACLRRNGVDTDGPA